MKTFNRPFSGKAGNELEAIYRQDMHRMEVSEQAVKYDEEYIKKLTQFQKKMKTKEMRALNRQKYK